jgi:hypothetical protein
MGKVTPEMAEAGGWAFLYWSTFSDEPDHALIARNIYAVMDAVAAGQTTVSEVRDQTSPNKGHEFLKKFS